MAIIKDEEKLLSLFVDKEHSKDTIRAPFLCNGYVCATDNHILVMVNPEALTKLYTPAKLKLEAILTPQNVDFVITIQEIEAGLAKLPQIVENNLISPAVECDECGGEGTVSWEYRDKEYHLYKDYFDCPLCKGTGERYRAVYKPTGRTILDYHAVIGIYEAKFAGTLIQKVVDAAQHLGVDTIRYVACHKQKANMFILNDDVKLIIMPNQLEAQHWIKPKRKSSKRK